MRLRTFTADNMQLAMQMIRDSLGEDAVIISTKSDIASGVQVTAAFDDLAYEDDAPEEQLWFNALRQRNTSELLQAKNDNNRPVVADEQNPLQESLAHFEYVPKEELHHNAAPATTPHGAPEDIVIRIERILLHHGMNEDVLYYMLRQLQDITAQDAAMYHHYQDVTERWLAALISNAFSIAPLELRHDSCRHILIGPSGAGKTLTTAKIAAYCVKYNKPIHIISTDNKRAGGIEQLAAITDILGIELQVAESRQSLKSILSDIPLAETVIVDSAGANPYDFYELKELAEYASLIELDPVLIYPAGSDPMEADEVARAFSFIGVEKMIVTRIDTARRFGGIFNAAHAAGLKFANMTASEKILGSFDNCTPEYLTKLCMDYQPPNE
jgi:flagellar biosynthesis protein FlhF